MSTDLRSGPDKMLHDELEAMGATLESFIIRSQRDWFPDLYGFRVTRADGSKVIRTVTWDLDTFSKVLAATKGEDE